MTLTLTFIRMQLTAAPSVERHSLYEAIFGDTFESLARDVEPSKKLFRVTQVRSTVVWQRTPHRHPLSCPCNIS